MPASDSDFPHGKAAALLEGRERVTHRDLIWLEHILWSEPEEQPKVLQVLSEMTTGFIDEARKLRRQAQEIEAYLKALKTSEG